MKQIILGILVMSFGTTFSQVETKKDSTVNELKEVTIENKKETFKYKNGNIKIDVANSVFKAIPNTLDLLAKLPKIQISPDKESISIIGKGNPLLYIDNQRVDMNYLNTLSVDDIKTIEIINNPSSKYEADGRAVILITRKLSRKEGFQTILSETASFKKEFNNYAGINSFLKLKDTEVKANFNYNALQPWESNGSNYEIPSQNIVSGYRVAGVTKRNNYVFGGGMFHTIDENNSLSFSLNGNLKSDDFDFNTNTNNQDNTTQTNLHTIGKTIGDRNYVNSFFNYNKKINESANLFAGLQYSNYNTDSVIRSSNNYDETIYEPFQMMDQDFKVDVFSGRLDFDKKFANEMKWEIGAIHSSANADTNLKIENFEQNTVSASTYNLKEKNTSAYIQLSGTFAKTSWLLGVRAENTNIEGKYATETMASIKKDYTNFFPKLQVDIPIDSTKTISFNYAKTISRPDFSSTSNGETYINPYFVFSSNINLNPALSNEFSVNFQYHDKSVKLGYFNNKNVMNYGFQYNEQENILIYRPENFDKETGYNLEFTLPFTHKIWSSTNVFFVIVNKIEDASALVGNAKPYLYYYSNQTFAFKKEWSLWASGFGLTQRNEGVFKRNAFFMMNIGVSKTYKNLSCTLSFNDIFNGSTFTENFKVNNVQSSAVFFGDNRECSIALRYTFGKLKDSVYKEKEVNENSDRIK
ncbi:TonB-dependent receptor domain-containing protein [Flavobacterium sp. PLA-1-15]|uniref:TonB-dependent receptor domain-containing protein n=1 Tax=Flavobacterium sp. PLA-1-15 TaxID=3380533 RepID=UPI003B7FC5D0